MKPFAEASEDWEPPNVSPAAPMNQSTRDSPTVAPPSQQTEKQEQTGFQGLIMNQVNNSEICCSNALID